MAAGRHGSVAQMTVRTSPEDQFDRPNRSNAASAPDYRADQPLLPLAVLGAGALALAASALVPVLALPNSQPAGPAFTSWPLLVTLAFAPLLVAVGVARRTPAVAAGLALGLAVLAPARALLDAQLLADAGLASRPEVVLPTSLAPLMPGPGLALLLIGHLLVALAGLLVLTGRWGAGPGAELGSAEPEPGARRGVGAVQDRGDEEIAARGAPRQGLLLLALGCGVLVGVGMLAAPFTSSTAFVLARSAFDGPPWALSGAVLAAALVPAAACLFVASPYRERARGALLGLGLGVATIALPAVAAGLLATDLHPATGPYAALLGAAGLAVLAIPTGRSGIEAASERDLVLPGADRLHRLAGLVALLAGALAAVGALTPVLHVPDGSTAPDLAVARLLAPAAAVLAGLGLALLLPSGRAVASRPALSVAWVVGPLAALAVLDPVLTATDLPGVGFGPGAWAAVGALAIACASGLIAALAGGVEREDVDLSALASRGTDRPVLASGVLAAALAVAAFVSPVAEVPGHDLLDIGGSTASDWGLLTGLLVVVLATLTAARCRPARGAALLAGAGLVVVVRLAELPLVAVPFGGAQPALGTWSSLACLVALVVAIALVMRPSRQ